MTSEARKLLPVTDTYWKILYYSNWDFFKLIITKRSVLSCLLAFGCQLFWSSLSFTVFKGMFLSWKFHIFRYLVHFLNTYISGVCCSIFIGYIMWSCSHKSFRRLFYVLCQLCLDVKASFFFFFWIRSLLIIFNFCFSALLLQIRSCAKHLGEMGNINRWILSTEYVFMDSGRLK